jgi:hypothetical protein
MEQARSRPEGVTSSGAEKFGGRDAGLHAGYPVHDGTALERRSPDRPRSRGCPEAADGRQHEDLQLLKQKTTAKQAPCAAVLSYADSRVPVEIAFDQTIGHVFITRVAGNIVTPEIIGSLEYGVAVLGTRVLMVLGHASCGAVSAAIAAQEVPGQISVGFYPLPVSR